METMVRLYTEAFEYQEDADMLSDDGWSVVACVSHRKGIVDLVGGSCQDVGSPSTAKQSWL
jgi:hypothetical protein